MATSVYLTNAEMKILIHLSKKRLRQMRDRLNRQKAEGTYFIPEEGKRNLDEGKVELLTVLISKLLLAHDADCKTNTTPGFKPFVETKIGTLPDALDNISGS